MQTRDKKGVFTKNLKPKKCKECNKEFQPRGSLIKFCSPTCYWKSMNGKVSKKRNGEFIRCKTCKKSFYVSGSRIGVKKYCSRKCAHEDNLGFQPRKKLCCICHKPFVIVSQLKLHQKTCSNKCHSQLTSVKHYEACRKYKVAFKAKHGRLYCEICFTPPEQTLRMETHHIYFASRFPKHKELHNPRNLILLCKECHIKFHYGAVYRHHFTKLQEKRQLKELFQIQTLVR